MNGPDHYREAAAVAVALAVVSEALRRPAASPSR